MEEKQAPIKFSPGNQFCFPGDDYAYSVDRQLRSFKVSEREILPLLDGSRKHGNPVIDNLITMDFNQRAQDSKPIKSKRRG